MVDATAGTMKAAKVKDPATRNVAKRPSKAHQETPKAAKKPKTKGKAAGAFKLLLNFLHLTDKKQACSETSCPASAVSGSRTADEKLDLPPLSTSETTSGDLTLKDHGQKGSLSKSWSYYVHDPVDVDVVAELEGKEDNDSEDEDGDVFLNDSYFEDDYCQDFSDHSGEEAMPVKSPWLRGIKMGISSVELSSKKHRDQHGELITTCGEFKRECAARKAVYKKHHSLPDVTLANQLFVPPSLDNEEPLLEAPIKDYTVQSDPLFGLNIVFDDSVLTDFNKDAPMTDVNNNDTSILGELSVQKNWNEAVNLTNEDTSLNPQMKANGGSLCLVHTSASKDDLKCPQTPKDQHRGPFYRDKRPSPLNITSTPDGKSLDYPSPDLAVFSDCPTTDNNMDVSPSEEKDSSDDELMLTAVSSLGHSKMETNSFPSSESDCDVAPVNALATTESPKRQYAGKINAIHRRSTESGYDSAGKPSSAACSPPDPKLLQALSDLNMEEVGTPNQRKPGIALSALGTLRSPAILDKLDGLLSPPRSARRCLSPRFKFPMAKSPPKLVPVLEQETPPKNTAKSQAGDVLETHANDRAPDKPESCGTTDLHFIIDAAPLKSYQVPNCENTAEPKTPRAPKRCLPVDSWLTVAENHPSSPAKLPCPDQNGNFLAASKVTSTPQLFTAVVTGTPTNKIPTPVSTSSPLQKPGRTPTSRLSRQVLLSAIDDMSPVKPFPRSQKSTNASMSSDGIPGSKPRRRKRRNISQGLSNTSARSPYRDVNNNRVGYDDSSSDEIEVISPTSKDYLILKRAADYIVHRIPARKEMRPYINMARLMEYLHNQYQTEISKLANKKVRTVSDFRNLKLEACNTFTSDRLKLGTCFSDLLVSVLLNRANMTTSCLDFVFENLHHLASCSDFLEAAPELILMILSNDHSVVIGPNGFPLAYKESERQVLRAVLKYLEAHRTDNFNDKRLENMLCSVLDPNINSKTKARNVFPAAMPGNHPSPSMSDLADLSSMLHRRPYHEIEYKRSETFVTTPNTRQEYLFQPFLSSALSSYPPCDTESSDTVMSLADDVMNFCNSAHTLRKLYFSYRRHNKVPYITEIGLQYSYHGRKKTFSIGAPDESKSPPSSSSTCSSANTLTADTLYQPHCKYRHPSDSHVQSTVKQTPSEIEPILAPQSSSQTTKIPTDPSATNTDGSIATIAKDAGEPQTKMSAVKLGAGEHVTGVAVQGDAVLHNVEITTNTGRHVRAHGLPDHPRAVPWTPIPPPEGGAPYCLQAMFADARTPSSRTYLKDIGAVWAVMSLPLNNLSA